ncbi:MAG TPA: NADPH:quinone oxidoreductase family protein [Polyangiaceae bacterium]|nr:NADPH:quinone oxidoreductase family protein [Polyangiaceae bacterium]
MEVVMKAVVLEELIGFSGLRVVEVERPVPGPGELLVEVKAAGLNYAELEQTHGRYPLGKRLPHVMGFEAAGIVVETGAQVENFKRGDRVAALTSSGGFAEYATVDASVALPIPDGLSYQDATTIVVQGLSAYALLNLAAKPRPDETLLVQAAAGGVGLYLVQLAKLMGVKRVIALASSEEKLTVVRALGADVAINYAERDWPLKLEEATFGNGVDVVLEMSSGEVQAECLKRLAPFGRVVFFGAKNMHDTLSAEQMKQLIFRNQSLVCFNIPTLRPDQLRACAGALLALVSDGKLKFFAQRAFPLSEPIRAFEALASRNTIGKVVLVPDARPEPA